MFFFTTTTVCVVIETLYGEVTGRENFQASPVIIKTFSFVRWTIKV